MRFLSTLGSVANGWLKFFVALAAVGWFGLQTVDRIVGEKGDDSRSYGELATSDETLETPVESAVLDLDVTEEQDSEDPVQFVSFEGTQLASFGRKATDFAGKPSAMAICGLVSAFVLGLVSRPGIDWFRRKRRISAAKRRARQYEEDQQLLAEVP